MGLFTNKHNLTDLGMSKVQKTRHEIKEKKNSLLKVFKNAATVDQRYEKKFLLSLFCCHSLL